MVWAILTGNCYDEIPIALTAFIMGNEWEFVNKFWKHTDCKSIYRSNQQVGVTL